MHPWSMDLGAYKGAGTAWQGVVRWVEGLAYMVFRKLCDFGPVKFAKYVYSSINLVLRCLNDNLNT